MDHPALDQSPRAMFVQGLAQAGERSNRGIAYDDVFLKETMPTTRRELGKIQRGRGNVYVMATSTGSWLLAVCAWVRAKATSQEGLEREHASLEFNLPEGRDECLSPSVCRSW
jgi:hypothetical protein